MLTSRRGFDLPVGRLHPATGDVSALLDRGAAQEGNVMHADAAGDLAPDPIDKAVADGIAQLGGVLKDAVRNELNKGQPPPPPAGPKIGDLVMIGAAVTAGVVIVALVVAAFRR